MASLAPVPPVAVHAAAVAAADDDDVDAEHAGKCCCRVAVAMPGEASVVAGADGWLSVTVIGWFYSGSATAMCNLCTDLTHSTTASIDTKIHTRIQLQQLLQTTTPTTMTTTTTRTILLLSGLFQVCSRVV